MDIGYIIQMSMTHEMNVSFLIKKTDMDGIMNTFKM